MKHIALVLALGTLAPTLAACSKSGGGASCDKVVDHTAQLAKDAFGKAPDDDRAEMIKRCEAMPAKVRDCALAAKDIAGMAACAPR